MAQRELMVYVLQEIAGQEHAGGASIGTIRTMVDGRQRIYLTDAELASSLEELAALGYILKEDDRYRIAPKLRDRVPRGADGAIRMDRRVWEALARELRIGV